MMYVSSKKTTCVIFAIISLVGRVTTGQTHLMNTATESLEIHHLVPERANVTCQIGQTTILTWKARSLTIKQDTLKISKQSRPQLKDVLFTKTTGSGLFVVAGKPNGRLRSYYYQKTVILVIINAENEDGGIYLLERRDAGTHAWESAHIELIVSPLSSLDTTVDGIQLSTVAGSVSEFSEEGPSSTLILAAVIFPIIVCLFVFGIILNEYGKYRGHTDSYQVFDMCCPDAFNSTSSASANVQDEKPTKCAENIPSSNCAENPPSSASRYFVRVGSAKNLEKGEARETKPFISQDSFTAV